MKTHLYDSTEPATEFVTIKALCGTNVHKAAFVTQGEEDFRYTVPVSCYRCRKTKKYRYILTDGEQAKQSEGAQHG